MRRADRSAWIRRPTIRSRTSISAQVIEKGDGISTKILSTSKDVQDPGKKIY